MSVFSYFFLLNWKYFYQCWFCLTTDRLSYSHLVVKRDVGEVTDIEAQEQTREKESGSSTKKCWLIFLIHLNNKPINPNWDLLRCHRFQAVVVRMMLFVCHCRLQAIVIVDCKVRHGVVSFVEIISYCDGTCLWWRCWLMSVLKNVISLKVWQVIQWLLIIIHYRTCGLLVAKLVQWLRWWHSKLRLLFA